MSEFPHSLHILLVALTLSSPDPPHRPKTVVFPKTGSEFLILGKTKNFSCEIFGKILDYWI